MKAKNTMIARNSTASRQSSPTNLPRKANNLDLIESTGKFGQEDDGDVIAEVSDEDGSQKGTTKKL